jgi:hypothetical protein
MASRLVSPDSNTIGTRIPALCSTGQNSIFRWGFVDAIDDEYVDRHALHFHQP